MIETRQEREFREAEFDKRLERARRRLGLFGDIVGGCAWRVAVIAACAGGAAWILSQAWKAWTS